MRRGFKTEARALALEVRAEIGLTPSSPFDPYLLAHLYGIEVVRLSELSLGIETHAVSGALIPVGTGCIIIENDGHSRTRCRLTASHEMSHVVLEHEFPARLVDSTGCRDLPGDQEDEADHLAGEFILPSDVAFAFALRGTTDLAVAGAMEISVEAARWRMNASGARKVAARKQAKYR